MAKLAARVRAGPAAVASAIALARRFSEAALLPAAAADRLAIVVEEWVANLVEHGRAPAGSVIALAFHRTGDCVRLSVTDAGQAFDPRAATFDGPNAERGGGAGLALIRAWCRIAGYAARGGRNRLVLELRLHG